MDKIIINVALYDVDHEARELILRGEKNIDNFYRDKDSQKEYIKEFISKFNDENAAVNALIELYKNLPSEMIRDYPDAKKYWE